MEGNLIESKAMFGLHLEGESEIEVAILSDTIRDIAELAKEACKEENSEAYLKMNVTAFRNGSFVVDFSAACSVATSLIVPLAAAGTFAYQVIGTIKGYFEIKKLLKGEGPKSIVDTNDGKVKITNNQGQILLANKACQSIFKNARIDQMVINVVTNASSHNPSGGFAIETQDGKTEFSASDIRDISRPLQITSETIIKRTRMESAELAIKKPDLIGRSTWEFRYKDHVIHAKIDDEIWIERINDGTLSIRAGDYIRATLDMCVDIDLQGTPIPNTEKYNVVKVHGDIYRYNSEQLTL